MTTKISHFVVKPVFIIFLSLFMVASAVLSGWALTTAWNAKSREITVARQEAHHAVQEAQQAQIQNARNNAKSNEANRVLVCKLVNAEAKLDAPQVAHAWLEIGRLPTLHCNK